MKKGKIIVIEGTDGSGKETQSNALKNTLLSEQIPCELISFPRYCTPTGRIIGQCYLGKLNLGKGDTAWFGDADKVPPEIAASYYAIDRKAAVPEIEKILSQGKHLILDRWVESNMAHQGGKCSDYSERKAVINFIQNLEYHVMNLPKPDLVVFLYMPLEITKKLRQKREPDGHESNELHLRNAEKTYIELAETFNWKKIKCFRGSSPRPVEEISKEVYNVVKNELKI